MMTDEDFLSKRKAHLRVLHDLEGRLSTLKGIIKRHKAQMDVLDRWLLIEHDKEPQS